MMRMPLTFALGLGVSTALLSIACGSTNSGGNGNGNGSNGVESQFQDPNANGNVNPQDVDPKSACATSSAAGVGVPASLVFMFDRSGSMDDNGKWPAVTTATKAFFSDQSTAGLSASLSFFPQRQNDNDNGNVLCQSTDYTAPKVPMTALPSGTFGPIIDGTPRLRDTPTLPALEGAIDYAKQVEAGGTKAAVVLVTDGEPNHCGSDVTSVSNAAKAAAASIKTYVIGVGDALKNLNAIAAAGGTGQAILVATADPAKTAEDFRKALGVIAAQALSCDYKIPLPPNGQTIDPNKVNVKYSPASGAGTTLTYNAQCTGEGWHYDNPTTPTKILLCPATCDAVMKDKNGKVEVFFGCAVKGGIPK